MISRATPDRTARAPVLIERLHPLLALGLLLTALPFTGVPVQPGLDESYRFAFNHAFAHGLEPGRELLFTYGPLAFALFPMPVGRNLELGSLLALLAAAGFALFYTRLVCHSLREAAPLHQAGWLLVFGLLGSVVINFGVPAQLVGVTCSGLLLSERRRNPDYLALPYCASLLACLMKSSLGLLCLMLTASHALMVLARRRRAACLLASLLYLPPALLLGWWAAGGSAGGLLTHARATWELSAGYFSAMSWSPGLVWWPLLLGPLALGALALWRVLSGWQLVWLALPLLPYTRYALARADHVMVLLEVLAAMLPLLITLGRDSRRRALLLAAALVMLATVPFTARSVPTPDTRKSSFLAGYLRRAVALEGPGTIAALADLPRKRRELGRLSGALTLRERLPGRFRRRIGQACVGIYPWNVTVTYANGLRWCPRPVFQSYTAYTPWLDRQNASWLRGPQAAPFYLWTLGPLDRPWTSPQWSIDGRYLLSDEPQTALELLRRYRVVDISPRAALLRRVARPLFEKPRALAGVQGAWERWLPVPAAEGGVIRARVHPRRTLLGWLRRSFLDEQPVYVTYAFRGGGQVRHRFVPDNAPSGLWIQPYVDNPGVSRLLRARPLRARGLGLNQGRPVAAVRFSAAAPSSFLDRLPLQWERILPARAEAPAVR